MEEKEYSNIYTIPANYTDSGKIMGGMLEVRNAVETGFLVALVGYPEVMLIPMPIKIRIVVMTLTLLPLGVLSMMGIDGDSLFQYASHMIRYAANRRKLHFRRVGYRYDAGQLKRKQPKKKKTAKKKRRTGTERTRGKKTEAQEENETGKV